MNNKIEPLLIDLWNENQTITSDSPKHLTYGNLVYLRALKDAANIVCFYCEEGHELTKMHGQWVHLFRGGDNVVRAKESCKANAIQAMMES